jgi:hypothetical protein
MAASRFAIVIVSLVLLASSLSLVHARMMLSDHHLRVNAGQSGATPTSASQDLRQQASTAPPALTGQQDIAAGELRRIITQVQGSVPSPGVGHH